MKMFKLTVVITFVIFGLPFMGCGGDDNHKCGDICYEHNTVYGILVTGGNLVTQARVNTIKAAIDKLTEYGVDSEVTLIKNKTTEFRLVAGSGATVVGNNVIEIGIDTVDHADGIEFVADALYGASDYLVFLHMFYDSKLAMKSVKDFVRLLNVCT